MSEQRPQEVKQLRVGPETMKMLVSCNQQIKASTTLLTTLLNVIFENSPYAGEKYKLVGMDKENLLFVEED